jgi:hypothetical protein
MGVFFEFFEGVLRVIYCSLYVGFSVVGLIFGEAIFLMRTSKLRGNTTSTLLRQLILHYEDSVRDPQTLYRWKAENLSFLNELLGRGVTLTSLLIKKRQSWALVLRYSF